RHSTQHAQRRRIGHVAVSRSAGFCPPAPWRQGAGGLAAGVLAFRSLQFQRSRWPMRSFMMVTTLAGLVLANLGCGGPKRPVEGPYVEAFVGRVTQDGKPVSFPEAEDVSLEVVHRKSAYHFGIPLKPDGTFTIGWMPIGDYSVSLERTPKG